MGVQKRCRLAEQRTPQRQPRRVPTERDVSRGIVTEFGKGSVRWSRWVRLHPTNRLDASSFNRILADDVFRTFRTAAAGYC